MPLGFGIAAVLTQIGYVLWSLWLLVVGVFVLRSREREGQPTAGSQKVEPGARMKGGKAEASKQEGEESQ